jgi:hypothetical protein
MIGTFVPGERSNIISQIIALTESHDCLNDDDITTWTLSMSKMRGPGKSKVLLGRAVDKNRR